MMVESLDGALLFAPLSAGFLAHGICICLQVDVLLGGWLMLAVAIPPGLGLVLGSVGFVYVGHALGMRATAR